MCLDEGERRVKENNEGLEWARLKDARPYRFVKEGGTQGGIRAGKLLVRGMKWVTAENLEVCDDWGHSAEVLYKVQRTETGVRIGRIGSGSDSMSIGST